MKLYPEPPCHLAETCSPSQSLLFPRQGEEAAAAASREGVNFQKDEKMATWIPLRWRNREFLDTFAAERIFRSAKVEVVDDFRHVSKDRQKDSLFLMMQTKPLKPIENTKEFRKVMLPAFKMLLLFENLLVLDLTGFVSFFPSVRRLALTRATIFRISHALPRLEELVIKCDRQLRDRTNALDDRGTDEEMLDALYRLRSLTVLQLEVLSFHLPGLLHLSENLPQLGFVSTNLTPDLRLPTVQRLQKSFGRLKGLLFCTGADEDKRLAFRRFCITHLPRIQFVEDYASQLCASEDWDMYEALSLPADSDLRHLTLDYDLGPVPVDLPSAFPRVTHLKIDWAEFKKHKHHVIHLPSLLRFECIESLELLEGVPPEFLTDLLGKYGPNLLALMVGDCHSDNSLTYNDVLSACPNLTKLCLVINNSNESINSFANLEKIKINLNCFKTGSETIFDILKAPNLEHVELFGRFRNVKDLKTLTSLMVKRVILSSISTLDINLDWRNFRYASAEKEIYFKKIAFFIKRLINVHENTRLKIRFSLHERLQYTELVRCLDTNASAQRIECELGPYFRGVNLKTLGWMIDVELIAMLEAERITIVKYLENES